MEYRRTRDTQLIREIMTHPKIYPYISDDFSPICEEFIPAEHDTFWHMLVDENEENYGLFLCVWHSPIMVEVHTCLLPTCWGQKAVQATKGLADWLFIHGAKRIITAVPGCNLLALRLAEKTGMVRYGLNVKSYQKNGQLEDMILLGMSA